MLPNQEHPSDETLLQAIDAELSEGQKRAVDRHLSLCDRCRLRRSELAAVADEVSGVYRRGTAEHMVDSQALRDRIQAGMTEIGAALDRSWWWRVHHGVAAIPFAVRATVALALVVFVLQVTRPAPPAGSFTTPLAAIASEGLPIRTLTPGAADRVSLETLCAGQPPVKDPIPPAVRRAVLRQYRMEQVAEHEYELDYLITPELGGVANQRNIWPERYGSGVWNARVKDDLEELLPQLVCQRTLALVTAQREIANDWIAAYKKYFKTDRPIDETAGVLDNDHGIRQRPQLFRASGRFVSARRAPFIVLRVSLLASR
jgi:anti-sigma factor RsiW